MTHPWLENLLNLPGGYVKVVYHGKLYGLRHEKLLAGKIHKVFAEELGGRDVISLNLYRTSSGPQLKPCEMPIHKVIAFLEGMKMAGSRTTSSNNNQN